MARRPAVLLLFLLLTYSCSAFAADRTSQPINTFECTSDSPTSPGLHQPLGTFKTYCFKDKAGVHRLYLTGASDPTSNDSTLYSTIEARLTRLSKGAERDDVSVRDKPKDDEAGISFLLKQMDLNDINGDGQMDPLIVYRIYGSDGHGNPDRNPFRGRIQMILFYRGSKIVIQGKTGLLDDERSTIATANYLQLPHPVRTYLAAKMRDMYFNNVFGFDNSDNFNPSVQRSSPSATP